MKTDPAINARPLRARYYDPASFRAEGDSVTRPPLAFDDNDGDATAAWLGHVQAGRIKVL